MSLTLDFGEVTLPKMDGHEIRHGVYLVGEPWPVPGTSLLRCLCSYMGACAIVELSIKFPQPAAALKDPAQPQGEAPC